MTSHFHLVSRPSVDWHFLRMSNCIKHLLSRISWLVNVLTVRLWSSVQHAGGWITMINLIRPLLVILHIVFFRLSSRTVLKVILMYNPWCYPHIQSLRLFSCTVLDAILMYRSWGYLHVQSLMLSSCTDLEVIFMSSRWCYPHVQSLRLLSCTVLDAILMYNPWLFSCTILDAILMYSYWNCLYVQSFGLSSCKSFRLSSYVALGDILICSPWGYPDGHSLMLYPCTVLEALRVYSPEGHLYVQPRRYGQIHP